jgi:hypothetical protein
LNYTVDQRKAMAKVGMALPDGSYPIKTRQDLKNAIHLVGQGNAPTSTVKAFCIKRAKALHALDMIPPSWLDSGAMKQSGIFLPEGLAHHGVKGMKWGVRKDSGHEGQRVKLSKLPKLDKKFEKGVTWIKVQNTFADHINPMLNGLNASPKYHNKDLLADPKLHKQYLHEYDNLFDIAAKRTSDDLGMNPSGTKRVHVTRDGEGENAMWTAKLEDVQHDAMSNVWFVIKPVFNETGHIISVVIHSPEMMQSIQVSEFLEHFGVKGMHWGVRRSRSGASRPTSTDAKKAAAVKAKINTHGRQSVSNKQLKDLVHRMNLEQQHANLAKQSSSFTKGHERVKNILAIAGTVNVAFALASSPMGKAIRSALKSGLAKTAANTAVKTTALAVGG